MMSSSLKSKNILSKHKVESLVSSGAQKAIKETGQGGEVSRKIPMGNGAGFGERACFHTFRRHYGTIWLSPTCLFVI